MNVKRRAIEGMIVACLLVLICTIADAAEIAEARGLSVPEATNVAGTADTDTDTKTELNANGTAGVVVRLEQLKIEALEELELTAVSVNRSRMALMATAEEAVPEEALMTAGEEAAPDKTLTEEELAWENRLMAKVEEFLNVRAAGDENASIVGKLYKGAVAEIVEVGDAWTHITSGNVDGYVKNDYCVFGQEAFAYAKDNFDTVAKIQTDGLRVRSEANVESAVITAVYTGDTLIVDKDTPSPEEWVAVKYGEKTAYVSAEYVTTELELGVGITIAEEQAAIAKAREEEAARKAAQITEVTVVQNQAVAASADEVILLAAIIQCEAGSEPYEGQVAVGAVVMNRVRSGRYPNSIYEVIYQPGQFTPAGQGSVEKVIANGPKASCIQAAQEALNGTDNTGGATSFRRASSGHAGLVISNHVFF